MAVLDSSTKVLHIHEASLARPNLSGESAEAGWAER
jgi:hypothetical protein